MKRALTFAILTATASSHLFGAEKIWNDSSTDFNGSSSWTTAGAITSADAATMGPDSSITNQPNLTAPITIQQVRFTGIGYDLSGTGGALTLTSTGTSTASGTGAAIAALTTAGNNTVSANLTLGAAASSTQTFTNSVSNNLLVSGNIGATNSAVTLSLVVGASTEMTLSGRIDTGTGNVSKTAATGTLKLTGTNSSYTGTTTVSGGVMEVSKLANGGTNSSIGASSSVSTNVVLAGGTLRYVGTGDSTDRLVRFNNSSTIESSGSGALVFTNTGSATVSSSFRGLTLGGTNTGNNTLAWTVNGSLSGGVNSITKTGGGKWILTGTNTYQSTTTVSDGTLLINGSHTGGGSYSVSGALGGSGTLQLAASSTFTVNSGGSIAPGANTGEIGTLTFNGASQTGAVATFATGSSFTFDINATSVTSDRIALTNGAANDFVFNNNVINFNVTGSLVGGQEYTLFTSNVANAYSGLTFSGSQVTSGLTFTGLSGVFAGSRIDLVGNNLVLTVVPEPSTWAVMIGGFLLTMIVLRRRNAVRSGHLS